MANLARRKKWRLWFRNKSYVVVARDFLSAEAIGFEREGEWPTDSHLVYSSNKEN